MSRPHTRSQTRAGTSLNPPNPTNSRNPLAPQPAGVATARGHGRERLRTAHAAHHSPLNIVPPSPLDIIIVPPSPLAPTMSPLTPTENQAAAGNSGLGDFREFFVNPEGETGSRSNSPYNSPVANLCPSGQALAARDTEEVSQINLLHTFITEHRYFQQTNTALRQQVQTWSDKELHREFGLLKEKTEKTTRKKREEKRLRKFWEDEYEAAEAARIIAEDEKEEAISARQDALWSHEVDRQLWQEFMTEHCAGQRPRACTRVGALLDTVVGWWES